MIYKPGLTLQDLDNLVKQMDKCRPAQPQPVFVGEFGKLVLDIEFAHPKPKNCISHWYLPKRTRKVLAEGRIGRKESNLRVVVYRQSWTSETGTVQFIGPGPEHSLVSHPAKRFRYELYDGTKLILQTNDLNKILNH